MIDRAIFYKAARESLFGGTLSQKQVDGMNAIIDSWEATHDPVMARLAYVFATAYHEAKAPPSWKPEMQPVHEAGGNDYFFRMYDPEGDRPEMAKANGNIYPGDGVRFHGRGLVQITWRSNYKKMGDILAVDLVEHPDLALEPETSTRILIQGMIRGTFTGKALKDYFPPSGPPDFKEARRIINGTDKAEEIAGHARKFHAALLAAT